MGSRVFAIICAVELCALLTYTLQEYEFSTNSTATSYYCQTYVVNHLKENGSIYEDESYTLDCVDMDKKSGQPWYITHPLDTSNIPDAPTSDGEYKPSPVDVFFYTIMFVFFLSTAGSILGIGSVGSLLILVIPLWFVMLTVIGTQWMVYGPMTGQPLWLNLLPYTQQNWRGLFYSIMIIVLFMYPFYGSIQRFLHLYYRYKLLRGFFYQGKDMSLVDIHKNVMAPNLLMALTINDYVRPDDDNEEPFQSYVITTQFVGSQRTGYCPTPVRFKLSKSMACSGAAVDGVVLQSAGRAVRLMIALLNLSQGSWNRIDPKAAFKGVHDDDNSVKTRMKVWFDRLPEMGFIFTTVLFICLTDYYKLVTVDDYADSQMACQPCKIMVGVACSLIMFFLVAVFFTGFPICRWLYYSPLSRQFMMCCGYPLNSTRPSRYVYLTDGGFCDDLGLIQMIKRRLRNVVVIDAGDDPNMEMIDLHDCMRVCREQHLASFYNPKDPRMDVEIAIDEYVNSDASFLHLKIIYGWNQEPGTPPQMGDLYHIRMRLPKGPEDKVKVQPTISPGEVTHGEAPDEDDEYDFLRSELGGMCCLCCHKHCKKCCGGYPNIDTGNQFFTELMFANFCRLGYELSEDALLLLKKNMTQQQEEEGQDSDQGPSSVGADAAAACASGGDDGLGVEIMNTGV